MKSITQMFLALGLLVAFAGLFGCGGGGVTVNAQNAFFDDNGNHGGGNPFDGTIVFNPLTGEAEFAFLADDRGLLRGIDSTLGIRPVDITDVVFSSNRSGIDDNCFARGGRLDSSNKVRVSGLPNNDSGVTPKIKAGSSFIPLKLSNWRLQGFGSSPLISADGHSFAYGTQAETKLEVSRSSNGFSSIKVNFGSDRVSGLPPGINTFGLTPQSVRLITTAGGQTLAPIQRDNSSGNLSAVIDTGVVTLDGDLSVVFSNGLAAPLNFDDSSVWKFNFNNLSCSTSGSRLKVN